MQREYSQDRDGLKPIDPLALLQRLKLTTGKAAEFCGVSRRQLCYWTDIGLVSAIEEESEEDDGEKDAASRRVYDFSALYKIMLIKQVLARSKGLRRAAKEINDFLDQREREAEELGASIEKKREEFLSQQADRLEALSHQIRDILPKIRGREKLLYVSNGIKPLLDMVESISAGGTVLEEDAGACLRLASLVEQLEARLESVTAG
jgi:DNA-binding transcriptional MerR regulator